MKQLLLAAILGLTVTGEFAQAELMIASLRPNYAPGRNVNVCTISQCISDDNGEGYTRACSPYIPERERNYYHAARLSSGDCDCNCNPNTMEQVKYGNRGY